MQTDKMQHSGGQPWHAALRFFLGHARTGASGCNHQGHHEICVANGAWRTQTPGNGIVRDFCFIGNRRHSTGCRHAGTELLPNYWRGLRCPGHRIGILIPQGARCLRKQERHHVYLGLISLMHRTEQVEHRRKWGDLQEIRPTGHFRHRELAV